MSRAMNIGLKEADVLAMCQAEKIGVSAIEKLPGGGVRLVCMSSVGAAQMRRKLKGQLIDDKAERVNLRPPTYR